MGDVNRQPDYKKGDEGRVDYFIIKLGDVPFVVERCIDLSKGLAGRESLPEHKGMIFDVHGIRPVVFHMKGCLIPLDIIFIRDGFIKKIYHNCPPCKEDEICKKYAYPSADMVVELLGGTCKKKNITEGLRYQRI